MLISQMIIDKNIKRKVNFIAETSQQKNTDDIKRLEVICRGCKDLSIYRKGKTCQGCMDIGLSQLCGPTIVGLTVLSLFVTVFMTC